MSDEEFHLSIKNNLRKIVNVREVFKNLTPHEKELLEYYKIRAEKLKEAQELALEQKWINESHGLAEKSFNTTTNDSGGGLKRAPQNCTPKSSNDTTLEFSTSKKNKLDNGAVFSERSNLAGAKTKTTPSKTVNFDEKNLYFTNTRNNKTNNTNTPVNETQENLLSSHQTYLRLHKQPPVPLRGEYFLKNFSKHPHAYQTPNKINKTVYTNHQTEQTKYVAQQKMSDIFAKPVEQSYYYQPTVRLKPVTEHRPKISLYTNENYNIYKPRTHKDPKTNHAKIKSENINMLLNNGSNYALKRRGAILGENFLINSSSNKTTHSYLTKPVISAATMQTGAGFHNFYKNVYSVAPGSVYTKTKQYVF